MAAPSTFGAVGCFWPPATTILPARSSSSSDTARMSATNDAPGLSRSARLKGPARGFVPSSCPGSPPFPPAPAASTATVPTLASSGPPLAPRSPAPAATAPSCPCPAAPFPAGCAVAGLSGVGRDDSTTYDTHCVREGGGRGGAACIRATLTRTPTNPGPPNPLTACGGGLAVAADDELHLGFAVSEIVLQHMASCT